MAILLIKNKKFELLGFESEDEFEKAVIENSKLLFGNSTFYIDTKMRVGKPESYHKAIPDGYLIDFSEAKNPQLYFVENELSTHDIYNHITDQLSRFMTAIQTSPAQIRNKLLERIKQDSRYSNQLKEYLKNTPFENLDELINFLVDKNSIKIVLVIDEATKDLQLSLSIYKDRPDIVTFQKYGSSDEIAYIYEPMREEISEMERTKPIKTMIYENFDTIVCAAFEDGFKHAYVENNAWWAIRISQKAREKLKYLAIYEKYPIAEIKHVAEIDHIEPYKDSGKFIVYLKNKEKLDSPIKLDKGIRGIAPQSPRFTTYKKLKSAKTLSELWA
jgi:hypothetical protein